MTLSERRNPVLALPAARRMRELSPEVRAELAALFSEIGAEANRRAEDAWRRRKGPMAAYWRAASTYAKHTARAIR